MKIKLSLLAILLVLPMQSVWAITSPSMTIDTIQTRTDTTNGPYIYIKFTQSWNATNCTPIGIILRPLYRTNATTNEKVVVNSFEESYAAILLAKSQGTTLKVLDGQGDCAGSVPNQYWRDGTLRFE